MNKKQRNRYKRMPLACKYWWRGMAKTNYRKQPKKGEDDRRFTSHG